MASKMSRPSAGRTRFIVIGIAGFLIAAVASYLIYRQPEEDCGKGRALIGGPFALIDQNGKTRTARSFRGKHMLVFFGYSYCPDFCPTSLQAVSETLDALGSDARRVRALFITIDPERDTVKRMKQYHAAFHKDIVMLTGDAAAAKAAAKAYRIYYAKQKPKADGGYAVDHSTYTYLMDRRGCYVRHFRHNTAPKVMAKEIREAF
jgi:cytochrome oxidase Cu insertion factor (SCO1/SenC/PrrC family)